MHSTVPWGGGAALPPPQPVSGGLFVCTLCVPHIRMHTTACWAPHPTGMPRMNVCEAQRGDGKVPREQRQGGVWEGTPVRRRSGGSGGGGRWGRGGGQGGRRGGSPQGSTPQKYEGPTRGSARGRTAATRPCLPATPLGGGGRSPPRGRGRASPRNRRDARAPPGRRRGGWVGAGGGGGVCVINGHRCAAQRKKGGGAGVCFDGGGGRSGGGGGRGRRAGRLPALARTA